MLRSSNQSLRAFTPASIGDSDSLSIGNTYSGLSDTPEVFRRPERTFWDRVSEAMSDNGMKPSQTAVADMIGIKQPSVSEWTKTGGYPTMENGVKLAKRLGVSVEWLYTGAGPKRPPPTDEAAERLWALWGRIDDFTKGEIVGKAVERATPPGQAPPGASKRRG